jgi:hypothetical protein
MRFKTFKINVAYPKALLASFVFAFVIVALLFFVQPYAPPTPQNPFPFLSYQWWMWWMFPQWYI